MASNNNLQTPPRRLSQHPLPSPALHPLRDALPHATPAPGDYNPFEDAFDDDDENEGEEALFLGFDCSTQALKCSLLDSSLDVLGELEVRFDRDLPQYQTTNGVLMGEKGSGEVYSPVLMCVHAMDLLLDKMARAQWPLSRIKAVSGAGQVRRRGAVSRRLRAYTDLPSRSNMHQSIGTRKRRRCWENSRPTTLSTSNSPAPSPDPTSPTGKTPPLPNNAIAWKSTLAVDKN